MSMTTYFEAILLGVVEGLTEFIPVSSTGHLILFIEMLGFQGPPGKVFEIVIQLGAIFAVCWAYRAKLWGVAVGMFNDPEDFAFVRNVVIAVLPALAIGAVAHGFIKSVLFSPWVVVCALILGGLAIIIIERNLPTARYHLVEKFPIPLAIQIGFCQVLAMIPGVSRSGATIMGALLLRVDRRTATEFSFFLAIPTMLAATVYDIYKNWSSFSSDNTAIIAIGFFAAFFAALAVVRALLAFVSRHGFVPFAYYRIVLGVMMALVLALR